MTGLREPIEPGQLGEPGARVGSADGEAPRWPLDWRELDPVERRPWFEALWERVCLLRARYRLAVRSRWWEDSVQVETLAATAAWVARYDDGEWDDPPGKLSLLFELERIQTLLRGGHEPFDPERDRDPFERHLDGLAGAGSTAAAPTRSGRAIG